ncbi:DUF4148 domain-containing protein [Burkholderia sp. L27(2015)]|jgi:hypothetical protein|uniref:DUF4148 domain-containing protein n=1 Tax=Burkholderia sp. L27(2015) TaxID=1641858 RepID=UPI00131D88E8|nr:DUF4148 domain-containing protein [Burkholderia sp. L27(2015)]
MKLISLKSTVAIAAVAGAALLAGIAPAQAQTTRAEVKAQQAELVAAGYRSNLDETQYPSNLQAAETRVQAQEVARAAAAHGQTYSESQPRVQQQ